MKLIHVIMILIFLAVIPLTLSAQSSGGGGAISEYFISIPALAALVLLLTPVLKKLSFLVNVNSQYISWGIAFLLSIVGWILNIGIYFNVEWMYIFIYGLASGLIANGLYDWQFIKSILVFLGLKTGEKK